MTKCFALPYRPPELRDHGIARVRVAGSGDGTLESGSLTNRRPVSTVGADRGETTSRYESAGETT
jgi:hypothetical protein